MTSDRQSLYRRFGLLALSCIHREYPNKIAHVLTSESDVQAPHQLTPAFFGCFDWHSAVHGHWLLVRLARLEQTLTDECCRGLAISLTKDKLQVEARYLANEHRITFERPYGLAWLLQLAMELDEWAQEATDKQTFVLEWRENIRLLESIVVHRLLSWLPKLSYAVRSGEHSQTAFALGLSLDYARRMNNSNLINTIEKQAIKFFGSDDSYPFNYEPSGEDFLSAGLAEADLMRRVLSNNNNQFSKWFDRFLRTELMLLYLEPPKIEDPTDPKLIHLAGLCLSRAWMLQGIAYGLSSDSHYLQLMNELSRRNSDAGILAIDESHYSGSHWLGTFAIYLLTKRGLN